MSKIVTSSGRVIDLTKISADDIDLVDIVEGLDKVRRFNGRGITVLAHTRAMVEYAEYIGFTVMSSDLLLHDAAEAYTGDIIEPVKQAVPGFRGLEDTVNAAIHTRLYGKPPVQRGLSTPNSPIKAVDRIALAAEYDMCIAPLSTADSEFGFAGVDHTQIAIMQDCIKKVCEKSHREGNKKWMMDRLNRLLRKDRENAVDATDTQPFFLVDTILHGHTHEGGGGMECKRFVCESEELAMCLGVSFPNDPDTRVAMKKGDCWVVRTTSLNEEAARDLATILDFDFEGLRYSKALQAKAYFFSAKKDRYVPIAHIEGNTVVFSPPTDSEDKETTAITEKLKGKVSAFDSQVGGDHYKKCKIQPVEFIMANGIGYMEGNVIKYVVRHKDKGGIADLEKAMHYLQMLIEYERKQQLDGD